MKKTLAVATLFAILTAAAFGQTIKIGGTWPLADVTGEQGSKAAQLAVEEINKAGGINGRQLQLFIMDDELKADKGVAAIEKLVTVDKVDFLMGGMGSGVALAQVPTMKKYQKIVMSTGAASNLVEKALGADAATIRNAFLVEAALLSLAGAVLGFLLGHAGAALIRQLYPAFPAWPPAWAVLAGLGTALVTGILFGVQPARQAARLDPVQALAKR
jgi:hypothetical protein